MSGYPGFIYFFLNLTLFLRIPGAAVQLVSATSTRACADGAGRSAPTLLLWKQPAGMLTDCGGVPYGQQSLCRGGKNSADAVE